MHIIDTPQDILTYLKTHPVIVLGTLDPGGQPHGAVIYAIPFDAEHLYVVTKKDTQKFQNILANPRVSVTIADVPATSTLQATGTAHVMQDSTTINRVMEAMTNIYAQGASWLPPITQLHAGAYEIVELRLQHTRIISFSEPK